MYQLLKTVFLQESVLVKGQAKVKSKFFTGVVSEEDATAIAAVHGWDCLQKIKTSTEETLKEEAPKKAAKKAE